jgi:hypothetical protein
MHLRAVRYCMIASILILHVAACPECEGVGSTSPQGVMEPAVLDLGPVSEGTQCDTSILIVNQGNSTLSIDEASLEDKNGDFELGRVAEKVGIGSEEAIELSYTSGGTLGERQSVTVTLQTNDPDDNGTIRGTVTAIPVESAAGLAEAWCGTEQGVNSDSDEDALETCTLVDFGAVNIGDASVPVTERSGLTKEVVIVNIGSAAIELQAALMNDGNPNFTVSGVRQGNILADLPIVLEPGRTDECGQADPGEESKAYVDIFYAPASLGSDTDTLLVLTDAIEGASLEVPVSGYGSDVGILITPPTVAFGGVPEGESGEVSVNVSNVGINDASVNTTCIDIDGDEVCDADCTGGDPALDSALNCEVLNADDESHEGKGFVLSPTDAQAGGADERIVRLNWNPVAGNSEIPDTAVLRIETNILNNRAYTARIIGGSTGTLTVDAGDFLCASSVCIPASGDASDVSTWTGSATLTLKNDGEATLSISSFEWEGPTTIADDYTLLSDDDAAIDLAAPAISISPGSSVTIHIDYANNDASGADYINLLIHHTGMDLLKTVPVQVSSPQ